MITLYVYNGLCLTKSFTSPDPNLTTREYDVDSGTITTVPEPSWGDILDCPNDAKVEYSADGITFYAEGDAALSSITDEIAAVDVTITSPSTVNDWGPDITMKIDSNDLTIIGKFVYVRLIRTITFARTDAALNDFT